MGGVIRRGAKLLHAFRPGDRSTGHARDEESYGGANIAMNSRSLGATAVFAWPDAEVDVMGAVAAVEILHRRELADAVGSDRETLLADLIARHRLESGGLRPAVALGVVDEVIDPQAFTWLRVAQAFAAAPVTRGTNGNMPL